MKKILCQILPWLACAVPAAVVAQPRLVVQIVVSSMRAGDLDRYAENFGEGGFRLFLDGGVRYDAGRYDYQQTTTPVSLATLTTGALPSTHGVVASRWRDYVENTAEELILDRKAVGLGSDGATCSPRNLIAPTIGETLEQERPGSCVVTIAAEPMSAVVMGGKCGESYWLDDRCLWVTSDYYVRQLPEWVARKNRVRFNLNYLTDRWQPLLPRSRYRNLRSRGILFAAPGEGWREARQEDRPAFMQPYDRMRYTPAGNTAVLQFAKEAVVERRLGGDDTPDLLNICLDVPRRVAEAYGPESAEMEDMYYRLDRDLADFMTFLTAQVGADGVLVLLTSDHGTSPSFDAGREESDRFNPRQFEVIVNSFLNVRFGPGEWVLEYADRNLYLNHNLIYEKGLQLSDVQNEAAIFALQFRGVSHALSATAMRSSYFGSGYARKMQNSFYPRRSGDVVLNFMPGWIEERERGVSASGSMYGYDTDVPLAFYGFRLAPERVARTVDMICVAPTLAQLLGLPEPAASEGEPLAEVVSREPHATH